MRNYWVVTDHDDYGNIAGNYGNIMADNDDQAEAILFNGILRDEYPLGSILIEEMMEDWQIQVYEAITDEDIISIEDYDDTARSDQVNP